MRSLRPFVQWHAARAALRRRTLDRGSVAWSDQLKGDRKAPRSSAAHERWADQVVLSVLPVDDTSYRSDHWQLDGVAGSQA